MATFDYSDIFGLSCAVSTASGFPLELLIMLGDFRDEDHTGQLPNGVGLIDAQNPTATQILYGLLMMLLKNQGATVNTDPAQKVYITDGGKSLATGTRDGQIRRSFTVSFFINTGLAGTPGIDQIDPPGF